MVFFYYIIRDYYLPLRTSTIAADLLGWLLYIVRARINLNIERKNICPLRQSMTTQINLAINLSVNIDKFNFYGIVVALTAALYSIKRHDRVKQGEKANGKQD